MVLLNSLSLLPNTLYRFFRDGRLVFNSTYTPPHTGKAPSIQNKIQTAETDRNTKENVNHAKVSPISRSPFHTKLQSIIIKFVMNNPVNPTQ